MLHVRLVITISMLIILTCLPGSFEYRILGIFPMNAPSHMIMFEQLMKGLARRGHSVDVVSAFPQKRKFPNYTDIIIPPLIPNFINNMHYDKFHHILNDAPEYCATVLGNDICKAGLESSVIQKLIRNPPKESPYDAVITEVLCSNCFMAFGRHLKVPLIGLSSSLMYPWNHALVANPENLAFVPNNLLSHMENMNLWNRVYNVMHTIYNKIYMNYLTSSQNDLIKKHFGPDMPNVHELERDLALILVNSHISLNGVKPTSPAHVEIGGLHIQDSDSEIPAEDKKWLDESEHGFVYFAFGSLVLIETFPKHILQDIYKSFRKIYPITVFMKVPQPKLLPPGLPENVRIFDWTPQLKVLKHHNIRAFITHGGLMSTQEAISCAVPMIGIPLFADQFLNIERCVHRKMAIGLNYHDLTKEKLDVALYEVLNNYTYRDMAKEVSEKFLDRRLSPMNEACYWVEYILKYGEKALKSPALDLTWWQIALFDIYLILMIAGIVASFIFFALVQYLSRNCR